MLIAKAFDVIDDIPRLHEKIFGEKFPFDEYHKLCNSDCIMEIYKFYENGEPIGYATVIDDTFAKDLHLWYVGFLQEYQGKGFLVELLEHLINKALNVEYKTLSLETTNLRPNMIRLAVNFGFDIVGVEPASSEIEDAKILFEYKVNPPIEWEIDLHDEENEMTFGLLEKTLVEAHKANCNKVIFVNANANSDADLALIKHAIRYCKKFIRPIEVSCSFSQF